MLRYAITNRRLFAGDEVARTAALIELAERLVRERVDFLQLREKDLDAAALLALAVRLRLAIKPSHALRLLLNGPLDLALRAGADGVHVPGGWTAESLLTLRERFPSDQGKPGPRSRTILLSVACHTVAEARTAAASGANLILFSPVFEKRLSRQHRLGGAGLAQLRQAVLAAGKIPVLALGGVTHENTPSCLAQGAAGIAGIRLFAGPG